MQAQVLNLVNELLIMNPGKIEELEGINEIYNNLKKEYKKSIHAIPKGL